MKKLDPFVRFVVLFLGAFSICYYGIKFINGLAVPGGAYSPFVEKYFNIASWMRSALMYCSKGILSLMHTQAFREDDYILRSSSGQGIRLVYSCLGFAVLSFWTAYMIATPAKRWFKIAWMIGGLLALFLINAIRLSLVLKAADAGKTFPFGWDHHTWFNIAAYLFIFILIFIFRAKNKYHEPTED